MQKLEGYVLLTSFHLCNVTKNASVQLNFNKIIAFIIESFVSFYMMFKSVMIYAFNFLLLNFIMFLSVVTPTLELFTVFLIMIAYLQIVTREAIYYGPADCSFIFSLVNWALPYAQRYILNAHPDKFFQLKQSNFEDLRRLQIVAVEKLFCRNVMKCEITSKKRYECSCLLQVHNTYYIRALLYPWHCFLFLFEVLIVAWQRSIATL